VYGTGYVRLDHDEGMENICLLNHLMEVVCSGLVFTVVALYMGCIQRVKTCSLFWLVGLGLPVSRAHNNESFLGAGCSYILCRALCPWSAWSEEISSITRLFSAHRYSNMPWVNTGSEQGSPVGVPLKGLTLWLPSWCEGLERLATFNIWTSGTPQHHAVVLNSSC